MKRREFITLLGGTAVAWPLTARAQQRAMPVVGFLSSISTEAHILGAFRRGLSEQGYVEGHNVKIEYHSADGYYDRLPALATDLVSLPVVVIAAVGSSPAAIAAKAATPKIPIVFFLGVDPVKLGLVASFNSPGGNDTGVSVFQTSPAPKRLELLHELFPKSAPVAHLVNPTNGAAGAEQVSSRMRHERSVATSSWSGPARKTKSTWHSRPWLDNGSAVFSSGRKRTFFPAVIRSWRWLDAIGFLQSTECEHFPRLAALSAMERTRLKWYRQTGIYVGKILKGASPADLPVLQPTTYELVINLKTAKALGLEVPPTLLARADEVIE